MALLNRGYGVLVVSGSEKGSSYLKRLLSGGPYEDVVAANNAGEAKRLLIHTSFDLIIINTPLADEFGIEFAYDVAEDTASGVLMLVKNDRFDQVCEKVEQHGILTISKPTSEQAVMQAVKLSLATGERMRRLKRENSTLVDKMNEIRIVNRAKCVLIAHLKFSEAEAHRYIEKQAMDLRAPKRKVAETIIKLYEN